MKTPEELTAEWNAGKLEDGDYYVRLANDDTIIEHLCKGEWCFDYGWRDVIVEVLAPVPDYEKFESLRKTANGVKYVSDKCWEKTKALEGNVTMFKSLFRQYLEREKEIESLRHYQTIQNEDIAKLRALLKEGARLLSFEHETYEAENFIKEANEVLK